MCAVREAETINLSVPKLTFRYFSHGDVIACRRCDLGPSRLCESDQAGPVRHVPDGRRFFSRHLRWLFEYRADDRDLDPSWHSGGHVDPGAGLHRPRPIAKERKKRQTKRKIANTMKTWLLIGCFLALFFLFLFLPFKYFYTVFRSNKIFTVKCLIILGKINYSKMYEGIWLTIGE